MINKYQNDTLKIVSTLSKILESVLGGEMRMDTFLLIVGFVILYLYDINSITKKYLFVKKFFFIGCIFIILANVVLLFENMNHINSGLTLYISIVGFVVAFILLIYTLFFALPFDDTYKSSTNQICDRGMYALCRHPGVIWFFLTYLCLNGIFLTSEVTRFLILANALNVLYVILQDIVIFPRIFQGYDRYKMSTPFLMPNNKSIRKCVMTIRG